MKYWILFFFLAFMNYLFAILGDLGIVLMLAFDSVIIIYNIESVFKRMSEKECEDDYYGCYDSEYDKDKEI